jgi:hypothetical protein
MYNSERDKNQDDDAVFIFNGKNGQVQGITKFHEWLNVILVDFFRYNGFERIYEIKVLIHFLFIGLFFL